MPDDGFPGTPVEMFPGGPTGEAAPAAPSGAPAVENHEDYVLQYVGERVYGAGDEVPVKWLLTTRDGSTPADPTGGSVTVRTVAGWRPTKHTRDPEPIPGDVIDTLTLFIGSSPPPASVVCGAMWAPPAAGDYLLRVVVRVGDDSQVRSAMEEVSAF